MQNIEAEQSVLGAILLEPDRLLDVSGWLLPDHFSEVKHAVIYNACSTLMKQGKKIDMITVSDELKENGTLKKIGGRAYLVDLVSLVPSSDHIVDYSTIVRDYAIKRKLGEVGNAITQLSEEKDTKVSELIEKAEKLIHSASGEGNDPQISNKDFAKEYEGYESMFNKAADGKVLGIRTGIDPLDEQTYGLIPGQIWVCGAYYGHGKTFFAINVINSLLNQGKKVMFFSLEMSAPEVIQRLVGLRAKLNTYETLTVQDDVKEKAKQEAKDFIFKCLKEKILVIDDEIRSANSILNKLKAEDMRGHVDLCVVDYIQLMSTGLNQYEELRDAMKNIQMVTKSIKTTMLLLSQINNEAQIAGKGGRVDGFKGAGDIGQIANVAMRIEREKDETTGEFKEEFLIRLTKIRHGRPGNIKLRIEFPGGAITNRRAIVQKDNLSAFFSGLSLADPEEETDL